MTQAATLSPPRGSGCYEDLLQHELLCLQDDNTLLQNQLKSLHKSMGALVYDLERCRFFIEEHRLEAPSSVFDELTARRQIGSSLEEDSDSVTADGEEEVAAKLDSTASLIETISRLQMRLARVGRSEGGSPQIRELEATVAAVESQLSKVKESRELLKAQTEQELSLLRSQVEMAKCEAEELREQLKLQQALMVTKENEFATQLQQIDSEKFQQKAAALGEVVEAQASQLAAVRAENCALHSSSSALTKELEYLNAALAEERKQTLELRLERNKLYDELSGSRGDTLQVQSELRTLQSQVEVSSRAIKARDEEVDEWRSRFSDLQKRSVMSQVEEDRIKQELKATVFRLQTAQAALQQKLEVTEATAQEGLNASLAKIAVLETENLQLRNQVIEVSQLHEQKRSEVLALETEKRHLAESNCALVGQLEAVEAEASILKSRHPTLDLGVLDQEVARFSEEKLALQRQVRKQAAMAEQLDAKLNQCASTMHLWDQRHDGVDLSLSLLEGRCVSIDQKISAVLELAVFYKKSHKILLAKEKTLRVQLSSVSCEVEALRAENQTLTDLNSRHAAQEGSRLQQLENELENSNRKAASLELDAEATAQAHRLEIQAHSRDIEELKRLGATLSKQEERHRAELQIQHKKLETSREKEVALQKELESSALEITNLRSQVQQLSLELDTARTSILNKLDTLELSEADLQKELAHKFRVEEGLKRELERTQLELERTRVRAGDAEVALERLRNEESLSRSVSPHFSAPDVAMVESNESFQKLLVELQLRSERQDAEIRSLQSQRQIAESRLARLQSEAEPLLKRVAALQGEISALTGQLDLAERDVKLYKDKFLKLSRTCKTTHEKERNEAAAEAEALRGELAECRKALELATAKAEGLQSELANEKADGEKVQREMNVLKSSSVQAAAQAEHLQQQLKELSNNPDIQRRYQVQVSNLQKLVQNLNFEKEQLLANLKEQQSLVSAKDQRVSQLESELEKVQKDAQAAEGSPSNETDSQLISLVVEEAMKVGLLSHCLLRQRDPNPMIAESPKEETPPVPEDQVMQGVDHTTSGDV